MESIKNTSAIYWTDVFFILLHLDHVIIAIGVDI